MRPYPRWAERGEWTDDEGWRTYKALTASSRFPVEVSLLACRVEHCHDEHGQWIEVNPPDGGAPSRFRAFLVEAERWGAVAGLIRPATIVWRARFYLLLPNGRRS